MVTTKAFERSINISDTIAQEVGTDQETVRKVLEAAKAKEESRRRQPAPPPPPGGISLRAAGRKYNIDYRTISRWVKKGLIIVLLETRNCKYISDNDIKLLSLKYNHNPGRGKRTIFN